MTNDVQTDSNIPTLNRLQFFRNKKLLIGTGAFLIIFVFTISLLLPSSNPKQDNSSQNSESFFGPNQNSGGSVEPTNSPGLNKAIDEAEKTADEYGKSQEEVGYDYPWLRKLPLVNEKFYVYYDVEQRIFIADLFLDPTDNAEQVKSDIQKQILDITKVPTENFQFQWNIKQK